MKRHLLVLACVGCGGGISSEPQPIVSVLKQDGDCFALMTESSPVAPTLGIAGTCTYAVEPRLFAGVDVVEVVVDYGPDVPFDGTTVAPTPEVVVTVDGATSDVPVAISDEYRVGERAYFVATFHAPAETSANLRISAGVNAGFRTLVPDVFATVAPPVSLTLLDCPQGTACDLAGAVGSAHLLVTVPGQVSQVVTISGALDGVADPAPLVTVHTQPVMGHTEDITAVPVPAAPDGTVWTLSAHLGDAQPAKVQATLREPPLDLRFTCAPSCSIGRGDPVGIDILAPAQIHPLQALVDTRIDGVPQLVGVPVTLVPHTDGSAVGTLALTAPTTAGTWEILATVAGYPTSLVTSVP